MKIEPTRIKPETRHKDLKENPSERLAVLVVDENYRTVLVERF